jgi:hypothetical protein
MCIDYLPRRPSCREVYANPSRHHLANLLPLREVRCAAGRIVDGITHCTVLCAPCSVHCAVHCAAHCTAPYSALLHVRYTVHRAVHRAAAA